MDEKTTNHWYAQYHSLVRAVPMLGTHATSHWYDGVAWRLVV
ncbi:MAG: hypothetical protein SPI30_03255 [Prevotella sp.]|nr:hypothetical protein [Prevotella sp.]